jgi:hypothetical protein
MHERGIALADVKACIMQGEIIEQYETDFPFPSCLVSSEDMHVVCSIGNDRLYVITAYKPSAAKWSADGRQRRPE